MDKAELTEIFDKYCKKLRIVPAWDVKLEFVEDPSWRKTGDFKVDCEDKKAVFLLNAVNPKQENLEEIIVHEQCCLPPVFQHAGANGGGAHKVLPSGIWRRSRALLRPVQGHEVLQRAVRRTEKSGLTYAPCSLRTRRSFKIWATQSAITTFPSSAEHITASLAIHQANSQLETTAIKHRGIEVRSILCYDFLIR